MQPAPHPAPTAPGTGAPGTGAPEISYVTSPRVVCDGASEIPGGAALGHPRVFLEIDESGFVDCGYCDRRFILQGGGDPAGH